MKKPCSCGREKFANKHRCVWHHLLTLPIEEQIRFADERLQQVRATAGFVERKRVPEKEWPAGERWCSGCQSFVPLFYTSGSRCRACNSRAAHKGHIERTYNITEAEYRQLLEWQDGRCYVCGQRPRKRRLAVDHDHVSNAVRGLLCANDEWGCNVSLRRLLDDLAAARRLLQYVEKTPLERMRAGERPPVYDRQKVDRRNGLGSWDQIILKEPPESPPRASAASSWQSDPAWSF